jgi:hypothetical protein
MLVDILDQHFADLDKRQRRLIDQVPDEKLFWTPVSAMDTMILLSVGGAVLRSAAMVEQAFLGITRRLWDDPFEWTLPEKLSTKSAINQYLDEVASTRTNGISFITSDADLSRKLPAPESLTPIFQVLVESIARSENFLGRGEAVYKLIVSESAGKDSSLRQELFRDRIR